MSSAEFEFLSELYRVDPWGDRRGDLRSAAQQADIRNMFKAKSAPATKPIDLMPYEQHAPTADDVAAKGAALVRRIATMQAGRRK